MLAVILATGAALGWGTADFLGGLKSRSVPMLSVLLISQAAALLLLAAAVAVIGEGPPPTRFVLYAGCAGLAEGFAVAALYRGLAVGTMSIVAPVAAIAPAVPLIAGLMIGEVPRPIQNAALVLVIAGVVMSSRQRQAGSGNAGRLAASIGYGLASALGFGIFFVALAAASEADIPWALFVARLSSVLALAAAVLLSRSRPAAPRADLPAIVLIGALIVGGDAMYASATTIGLLSIVAVVGALHTVVTVALARLVLREKLERLQQVGIAICLGGVLIIAAT